MVGTFSDCAWLTAATYHGFWAFREGRIYAAWPKPSRWPTIVKQLNALPEFDLPLQTGLLRLAVAPCAAVGALEPLGDPGHGDTVTPALDMGGPADWAAHPAILTGLEDRDIDMFAAQAAQSQVGGFQRQDIGLAVGGDVIQGGAVTSHGLDPALTLQWGLARQVEEFRDSCQPVAGEREVIMGNGSSEQL